jgi:polyhydroxybutyrate depolymerase
MTPLREDRPQQWWSMLPQRLAGVLAALVLSALPACSSGADEPDAAPPTTTTAPPPVTLAPAVGPTGAVSHGTLVVDGRERSYRLYVPRTLPDGPVPLFVGLHGGTGWGDQLAANDHIEGLAESNGFLVVHPDGVRVAGGPGGVWNGGVCCAVAAREGVDDVGFVDALLDRITADHDVDPRRVFAFGHSNGGIMSYRLACELADRIVGIGVVAGTLGVDRCEPERPVSVIHVHGTADENVPLAGGRGARSIAGVDFPPPRDGFAVLAERDGCPDGEEVTEGDVTTATRAPCRDGAAAAFVSIEGSGHAWPGGTGARSPLVGPPHEGYDATAELVAFLLSHPRP